MHRVRNSSWNPILFVLPYKNSDLRMRKKEILRRRGPMKSHIQTYALCLMLLSLSVPFFFLLSMSLLCVCNCSLFVFPPLTFFFLFVCPPSIYRDSKGVVPLFFSQLIRSWNSFLQFFLHNSLFHVEPWTTIQLFALFICSVCFLNSLFLVCDIPTFLLFRPTFMKPCSLLSGVATSHLLLFCFTWLVSIFCFCTRQQAMNVAHIIIIIIIIIIYIVVLARCRPYMTTLFLTYAII